MKKFGLFSPKQGKDGSAEAERLVWRAYEDQPLNLSAPQRGDTANSQRALVLGFAALAVAGAAYFGTVMLTHRADNGVSLFSEADAATTPAEPVIPAKAARANAAALPTPAAEPVLPPKPTAAPEPAATTTTARPAAPANSSPLVPVPVKVTTISIPAKPSAARMAAAKPAVETRDEANARWAALASEAKPILTDPAAYTEETKKMVSEGVEAVLRQVATEKSSKKPVMVASARSDQPVIQDADTEMAGNAPAGGRQARIRTAVNMRSGPADGSRVLSVIPTNSTVSLAPGCRHWCKVTYQGRTGYIYKSFVR